MNNVTRNKYLLILESPSKISYVEKIVGDEYQVIATCGHICNIEGLIGIDIKNNFEPKYTIIPQKRSYVKYLRSIIIQYDKDKIYIGTDDDSEGNKIAYDICVMFDLPLPTTKRIIFHEVTSSVIKEALNNPSIVNLDSVKSQQVRQILDILIGYKISPTIWKYMKGGMEKSLSVGRCQSVALKLIYENYQEGNSEVCPSLRSGKLEKLLRLSPPVFSRVISEMKYKTVASFLNFPYTTEFELSKKFVNKIDVYEFLELSRSFNHEIIIYEKKLLKKRPPQPFNTASLLQKFGSSPKTTMKLLQELYQEGLVTYIRTESHKYSSEFLVEIKSFLIDKFKNEDYVGDFKEIVNSNGKLPHEAIRVTNVKLGSINGERQLIKLYKLIYDNTIESCMSESTYNSYEVSISAPLGCNYLKTFEEPLFCGFNYKRSVENLPALRRLKCIKKISFNHIECVEILENLHQNYSECGLIKKLEELGIGRPSTYATFGDIIINRGYVKLENIDGTKVSYVCLKLQDDAIKEEILTKIVGCQKNKMVIQEIGIKCVKFLIDNFNDLFDYDYSKNIELKLEDIKRDSTLWWLLCDETNKTIDRLIKKIPKEEINTREKTGSDNRISLLGYHEDKAVNMKSGRFGLYLEWNEKNYCLKDIGIEKCNITINDAIKFIDREKSDSKDEKSIRITKMKEESKTILRVIDSDISIRKGKFGPYIYVKKEGMKKPKFISTSNLNFDVLLCEKSLIYSCI
jgi:DNA topoisomerase-1